MAKRTVDNLALTRWRGLDAAAVLQSISEYAKQDAAFQPRKNTATTRWHASVGGIDFELLCTGAQFIDTHANHGGGGAADLVMHLMRVGLKDAAAILQAKGL